MVLIPCALLTVAPVPGAHAQWTVTNLHPAGATQSNAWGASGANQVGRWTLGTDRTADWETSPLYPL